MNADKTSVFIGVYRRSSAAIHVLAFFSNLAHWRVILLRLLRERFALTTNLPDYFFFLGSTFLAGAAAHGEIFKFSTFAFSASMVSMNGSLVNAFGTPVH